MATSQEHTLSLWYAAAVSQTRNQPQRQPIRLYNHHPPKASLVMHLPRLPLLYSLDQRLTWRLYSWLPHAHGLPRHTYEHMCTREAFFFFLEKWFKSEWCCHMPCVSFGQWPHILLEGSSNGKAKPTSYLKICTRWQNMSGDFVFRPWWPWRLVLDPEGSGRGGSGGLYWEGWLPHGHVWAIAEGLNRIFCSKQKESPFQRQAANVTYRVLWPKRHRTNSGFSTECLTHPPICPSIHPSTH